ncbi:MAG: hypothetical protein ACO2OO_02310 [Candidatus Aenigmatarchaeota archaeon]
MKDIKDLEKDIKEVEQVAISYLKDNPAQYIIIDTKELKKAFSQVYKSINRLCPVIIFKIKENKVYLQAYPDNDEVNVKTIFIRSDYDKDLYICPFEFKKVISSIRGSYLVIKSFYKQLLVIEDFENSSDGSPILKSILTLGEIFWHPNFKVKKGEKLLNVSYLEKYGLFEVETTEGRVCYINDDSWLSYLIEKLKGYITYVERDLDDNFPTGDSTLGARLGRDEYKIEEKEGCDSFSLTYCYLNHEVERRYFIFYPDKKAYLQVLVWNEDKLYGDCYQLTYKWTGRRMFYKKERIY